MRRWLCFGVTLCLVFTLSLQTCLGETWGMPEKTAALMNAAFREFSTMGACTAVFENGEIIAVHTYGRRWLRGEPVTEDTCFQIGSISKMISNLTLMQLLEEKNISLDTELGEILGYQIRHPDFKGTPVTLRQLMTHTAALSDGGKYRGAIEGNLRPLKNVLLSGDSAFLSGVKPGTQYYYSNFGGGIIGSLIEILSGKTVDACMQEKLFGPLEIRAAFYSSLLQGKAPLADIYHMPSYHVGRILTDYSDMEEPYDPEKAYTITAGKLIISAPDLCKLLITLCDGGIYHNTRVMRESTVKSILTPQNYTGSVCCNTDAGLFLNIMEDSEVYGRKLYGHGGKAYGMLCAAYFDPEDRTGVVMLTNGCDTAMHNGVGKLGRKILSICYKNLLSDSHVTVDPFEVE